MRLSVCTISFRHQLVAISDIAAWAKMNRFQGIELWGIHALNLSDQPAYNAHWLAEYQLYVSMLSDYLPLDGPDQAAWAKVDRLCALARHWGTHKLRTFAGQCASAEVSESQRAAMTRRLFLLCERAADQGIRLVVETHPGTLADTVSSTRRLLDEVNHPNLRLNFDVLHIWEAGDDVDRSFAEFLPWIEHLHLKNIHSRPQLQVFAPANVYSPAGSREGMVSLFEGAFDYAAFLQMALHQDSRRLGELDASLEWFGPAVLATLNRDMRQLRQLMPDAEGVASAPYRHPQLGLVS